MAANCSFSRISVTPSGVSEKFQLKRRTRACFHGRANRWCLALWWEKSYLYHDVNWLKSAYESIERDTEIQQKGADLELFSSLKGMDLTENYSCRGTVRAEEWHLTHWEIFLCLIWKPPVFTIKEKQLPWRENNYFFNLNHPRFEPICVWISSVKPTRGLS